MNEQESSQVTFEGEKWGQSTQNIRREPSGLARFLIDHSGGLVRNETQAMYVLIGFIIGMALLSLWFIRMGGHTSYEIKQYETPPPGWSGQE